jgi:oxygen-independent coproporphyrinogen-3 oxidase
LAPRDLILLAREEVERLDPDALTAAGLLPRQGLYFPSIYYPPIPMYPRAAEADLFRDFSYDRTRPCALYVHLPFCRSKCTYCHWVTCSAAPSAAVDDYLRDLAAEIGLLKRRLGVETLAPHSFLLGGGTPTVLSARQLEGLFQSLEGSLDLSRCAQITCEAEPGTLLGPEGADRLKVLRERGVDRLSLGVQSFQDGALASMGRRHTASDAVQAIQRVRRAGFPSLSVDLIYGYPGGTIEEWLATLETAVSQDVDALQLYRLRIVPHGDRPGAIGDTFAREPHRFPPVRETHAMKALGRLVTREAGLRESCRRVFSKGPSHDSRYLVDHCDRLSDVLGLGVSAWSNLQGRFYLNTAAGLEQYGEAVQRGRLPLDRGKVRSRQDHLRHALVLPLKHNGVSRRRFREATGCLPEEVFPDRLARLRDFGLVEADSAGLRLTERGTFFADEVAIQFYEPRYLPFPRTAYEEGPLNPYRGEGAQDLAASA